MGNKLKRSTRRFRLYKVAVKADIKNIFLRFKLEKLIWEAKDFYGEESLEIMNGCFF
jgi:hypothetical protein